jgi:hypothetical protein
MVTVFMLLAKIPDAKAMDITVTPISITGYLTNANSLAYLPFFKVSTPVKYVYS